ncbi:MAG TPA: class I SAM-dependent methyltransferase [Candidatus Dormibacteraeota bacterium]|nr:class I SAM-dependent methyltransferase [Candidatus Dormibacteraeota bacterium]
MPPTGDEAATPFALDVLAKYALAHTVFAAHELGLWREFEADPDRSLDSEAFIAERGLEPRITRGIVDHLVRRQVLERCPDGGSRYRLAPLGRELIADGWYAYVVFYVGGYGRVLSALSALGSGASRYGEDVVRDTAYVARGTEMMSLTPHHASYGVVLDRAAELQPERVADVGCGSAGFLIRLVERCGCQAGIGIDVSDAVCRLAADSVRGAGLGGRIDIVRCDMRDVLHARPDLAGTCDVVTAMMVVHESLARGEAQTVELLRTLGGLLTPGRGALLILDKQTDLLDAGQAPPYLTEYKLVHDVTWQDLCSAERWRELVEAAGMRLAGTQALPAHTGSILLECRHAR